MERFGYGRTDGDRVPRRDRRRLMPDAWDDVIRATVSYGQGIAVTPMQMAGVYATIANGGTWVQPRLVRGTVGADGGFRAAPPAETHDVVRPTTADLLTRMLAYVVEDGTGAEAQIPGYQVAGKTGTSRKLNPYGQLRGALHGVLRGVPARGPIRALVIAVSIDEPDTIYGGVAAAPLFKQIARYAIQRLGDPVGAPGGPAAARPETPVIATGSRPGARVSCDPVLLLPPVPLASVVDAVPGAERRGDAVVRDVVFDSREVTPGALFCCVPGRCEDGHAFARRGASRRAPPPSLVERWLGTSTPRRSACPRSAAAMGPVAAVVFARSCRHAHDRSGSPARTGRRPSPT